ncbi:sce7726 family protein [Brevundimonas staleyi]|uniref:Sce7726 family protein n=1 Tax=Brevundimonas staleyi TaxID=74326 RepID=A0ABW0FTR1_9CAUL
MGNALNKAYDNEQSLKAKVIQRLRETKRFGSKPLIATEYCVGSTGVRADLVVASRATREITAIEIKSAADSLKRLPHQLDAYGRYFDLVILVAAHRHQRHVRQIQTPGLEIWEVEKSGTLAVVRSSDLVSRTENLSDLLNQRDKVRYRGLVERGDEGSRDAFFAAFEDRHGVTSDRFWSAVSGKITADNVAALSRFEVERSDRKRQHLMEMQSYTSWLSLESCAA